MKSLIFRNTRIRYIDMRKKEESMPFVRLHLSSDLTSEICEAMGWTMPADGMTDGSFAGKLTTSHLILTPNEKGLRDRELQIKVAEANDFKFVGEKDEESGHVVAAELRYIVRSQQEGVEAELGAYWRAVGDGDAQMKLSYTPVPVQQRLQRLDVAAVKEAVDEPPDEFADADKPGSPALASQMEMSGRRRGKSVQ